MKRLVSMGIACILALFALACAPVTKTDLPTPAVATAGNAVDMTAAETAAQQQMKTLLTNIQTDYFPGTAGCSLIAARLAGSIIDSYTVNRPTSEQVTAATQSFYNALPAADAQEYTYKLGSVYGAAQLLTQDIAAEYLASAGYQPKAFPWSSDDINAVFAAIYHGIGAAFTPMTPDVSTPSAQDNRIDAMMPILDSVVRAMGIGENSAYLPHDDAFLWNVLYLMGNNHAGLLPNVTHREADVTVVPRAVMDEVAAAAFLDYSALPALSKDNIFGMTFDTAADTFCLPPSDTGDADTKTEEVIENPDGTLDVLVGLYLGDGERLGGVRFILTENPYPSTQFPYSVRDAFLNRSADMWRQVDASQPFTADLDCDGTQETISVIANEDQAAVAVTMVGSVQIDVVLDSLLMNMSCYVADTQLDDGYRELYLCGDMASDDYVTYILRIHEGKLQQAEIFGSVRYATGTGKVVMESVVNVMGTYSGICRYGMQPDFTFALETPYTIRRRQDDIEYVQIALKKDGFPVTLLNGGAEKVLPKGTELTLAETDAASYAILSDAADGTMYRVAISQKPDDWQWLVGGVPESDWFTTLRYAG